MQEKHKSNEGEKSFGADFHVRSKIQPMTNAKDVRIPALIKQSKSLVWEANQHVEVAPIKNWKNGLHVGSKMRVILAT